MTDDESIATEKVAVEKSPAVLRKERSIPRDEFHTPGFEVGDLTEEDAAALQSVVNVDEDLPEMVTEHPGEISSQVLDSLVVARGTILEAAFVDPAYTWPPEDGEGKNAIELQATLELLQGDEDASVGTSNSMKERMMMPERPILKKKRWWQWCCNSDEAVEINAYKEKKTAAIEARKEYKVMKQDRIKQLETEARKKNRYVRVPEGVLIYRLDTSRHTLTLMSPPHDKTDREALLTDLVISKAVPSPDKSRRGMIITSEDGVTHTLIACEQRTATAWLEAMQLMLAKEERKKGRKFLKSPKSESAWSKEKLKDKELDEIEDNYMNLASYSNKLIRAGALPDGKKGSGGAGGIYYSIQRISNDFENDPEEEALEAIAKRRAVIKDSWDFFRMICSLLRDRNKYEEVFRRMKLDPVYPYLNSMTGLNDPGDAGYENEDKPIAQKSTPEYSEMSQTELAKALIQKAEAVLPSLVEICKALAGSLGMEEVGVGPIKDINAALRKAEKKYDGDLLKVTDYCRALLVVKDFPSLLALLELARDSFGPLIRRVKMSSLKTDHKAKAGGYRDCIINVELKDHICEIQVHLWPMWVVCGVDGFRHYRHCVEYNTDTFEDPYDALDGLDRRTMAELIVMAEEAVADTPLVNLEWYHEKQILDYFAEAGLFMKHGLDVWAEITLRHLIRLRIESPDIGPDHHETIRLYRYLAQSLRAQGKYQEATEAGEKITRYEENRSTEKKEAEKSLWEQFMTSPSEAYDMIMDPNKKERQEEEKLHKEVKASKKQWRVIRQERFPFLDSDATTTKKHSVDEKKTDDIVAD